MPPTPSQISMSEFPEPVDAGYMVRGLRLQIKTVANQLRWFWIIQVGLIYHKGL